MRTPTAYTNSLKNNTISMQMLSDCLYSSNKRAKNWRDKERECRDRSRNNRYWYDVHNNEEKANLNKLAKLVGYDFSNKASSPFWQTLHKSGIKGFRRGSEGIPYDMIANLGEDGTELQYDISKGVLKSVGQNDMIFTAEQAKTLMDFAKNPMMFSNMYTGNAFRMPNMPVTNRTDNDINITIGDVNLEGVQNPQQFASSMKDVIKNNTGGVRNMIKDTTVGSLSSNHNSLGIRKY